MLNLLCELAFCLSFVILMLVIPGLLTGVLTLSMFSPKKPPARRANRAGATDTASNAGAGH